MDTRSRRTDKGKRFMCVMKFTDCMLKHGKYNRKHRILN